MKLVDLAFLSLRLLAVYFFYSSVTHLANLYYSFMVNAYHLELAVDGVVFFQIHVLPALLLLGSGLLLWMFARKWAGVLAGERHDSPSSASFYATYAMLLSVAGVVVMVLSAGNLVKAIPVYFSEYAYTNPLVRKQELYEIVAQAVKLGLGLGLVIYARKVGNWLQKFADET